MTMLELAELKRSLGGLGQRVRIVFATLDPLADTPALLDAYLGQFDRESVGLRGSPAQIAATASHFKLSYQRVENKSRGTYVIDHGVQSYVFDPQGRLRLLFRPGKGLPEMAADIRLLLNGH